MKRVFLFLVVCFLLGLVVSQEDSGAVASTELAPLPADPRFDQRITFSTGLAGASLSAMVEALAQTVGLNAVISDIPDNSVTYNFGEKPFRQVWKVVLSLNSLDYVLQENDVVVVGTVESIQRYYQREPIIDPEVVQQFYRVSGNTEEFATALRAADPNVVVESIPNINTISVRGTQAQQESVAAVLSNLDPPPPEPEQDPPKIQRIYRLSNAKAEDIAKILQDTAVLTPPSEESDEGNRDGLVVEEDEDSRVTRAVEQIITTVSTAPEPQAPPELDFVIVPDARTNSLIINATAQQHEQFAELLPKLDIPQKQVNVQVRIQEITKESARNLGIDLNAGFGTFSAQFLETGLNFVFNAQRAISGLNIGAVLDTLERQGLSRKVDDASVTVLNNEKGSIQSGGTIFISLVAQDIALERTIPYGVQLDFEPQITNTGLVNLAIEAKVEATIGDVSDPTLLNISTKRVTSNVTLEPGQTVLLGGLFQNSLDKTTRGVPILSSIPLIGGVFKQTTLEERDSELLLIVTANIIE